MLTNPPPARSIHGVDAMLSLLHAELIELDVLENTYILWNSDQ